MPSPRLPEHRLNPAISLLCACIYSIALALLSCPWLVVAGIIPPALLLICTCKSWGSLFRRMRAPFLFIAFICLLVPFTSPGSPHPYLGQIGISSQGINLAILICLKCAGLFAVFSAFVSPLSSSDLGAALAKLHCPWQLAAMLVLMDMNIHIIQREWERLKTAADLRGFSAVTNMHSYRTLAAMLALWLIRAAERAKTTHEGMLLRGFDGHFPITQSASPSRGDRIFAVITILMAFGLLALNILWTYQL